MFNRIRNGINYQAELLSQLFVVFGAAITFGVMEGKWIDTGNLSLRVFGRFAYYHVGLLILMAVVSFALAVSHVRWLLSGKKLYVLFMCIGCLPLALLVEDMTWFVVRWQPIKREEWTMMSPGLGLNLFNLTWIPLWYFIATGFCITMFWCGNKMFHKHSYRRDAYVVRDRLRRGHRCENDS